MPYGSGRGFEIVFDFEAHELVIDTTDGDRRVMPLASYSVATFYARVMAALDELDLHTEIWPMPVEIEGAIPFDHDEEHATYDPTHATAFWRLLVESDRVFTDFRRRFVGKASPVHLFWGALEPRGDSLLRPAGAASSRGRTALRPVRHARGLLA